MPDGACRALMLAQLQNVDPTFLKQALLFLTGIAGGAATVISILTARNRRRQIEPQPLEVRASPAYATVAQCHEKHVEIGRRLDGHDHEITALWNTMRAEDNAIRAAIAKSFADIERALGRIEGKINTRL